MQKSLDIQLNQAVREINALRESQTLASQYRHDMRHHLQYVSACIKNGQEEQAQSYIAGICKEIEAQKVERYCDIQFENGIPVSNEPGHGIGVQSICASVEHYGGIYTNQVVK